MLPFWRPTCLWPSFYLRTPIRRRSRAPVAPFHIHPCCHSQNPHREIRRLADFLEIRCSDEVIAKVVENSSFPKMKKQAENSSFFRSGTVGDSARHFSLGLEAEFDAALREQMRGVADPYEK